MLIPEGKGTIDRLAPVPLPVVPPPGTSISSDCAACPTLRQLKFTSAAAPDGTYRESNYRTYFRGARFFFILARARDEEMNT
jgi:hypothetical protein